jgi:hypothetical protein
MYRIYARMAWIWTRFQFLKRNVLSIFVLGSSYTRFFWNSALQYEDITLTHVPSGTFHIEQWEKDGDLRRYVTHEEDEIIPYEGDPFRPIKKPWLWIGNKRDDSFDITDQLRQYLVPGNRVTPQLIEHVLHFDDIQYMNTRSFEVVKFPEEGIVLEADDTF